MNFFRITADNWGKKLVEWGLFLFLATNTWLFVSQFISADPPWRRPAYMILFEVGLIFWVNRLEHTTENVEQTVIAKVMVAAQLAVVLFATVYELSADLQK